jgi:hypothetical protein
LANLSSEVLEGIVNCIGVYYGSQKFKELGYAAVSYFYTSIVTPLSIVYAIGVTMALGSMTDTVALQSRDEEYVHMLRKL